MTPPSFNPARVRVEAGDPVFGPWVFCRDPHVVEAAAAAGFDFVAIDMEHTALTWETVEDHVRVANGCALSAFVRVAPGTADHVARALDIGAHGVCIPHVTRESARQVAPAFRYPPRGVRGTCTAVGPASRWPSFGEYARASDEGAWFIGLVEDRTTVAAIDGLLADRSADVILPGKADLSASYGRLGELDSTDVLDAVRTVITKSAQQAGTTAAAYVTAAEQVDEALRWGARIFFCSIDVRIARQAFSALVTELQSRTRTAVDASHPARG